MSLAPIDKKKPKTITLLGNKIGKITVEIRYTDETFDEILVSVIPEDSISVQVRHAQDVNCPREVGNDSFSNDESIVSLAPIDKKTPKTITLLGHKIGKTKVTIRYTDNTFDQVTVSVTS